MVAMLVEQEEGGNKAAHLLEKRAVFSPSTLLYGGKMEPGIMVWGWRSGARGGVPVEGVAHLLLCPADSQLAGSATGTTHFCGTASALESWKGLDLPSHGKKL